MKKKNKISITNIPREWALSICIIAVQALALTLIACIVKQRDWFFWFICAVLAAFILYFTIILILKIHKARLTIVSFTKDNITYSQNFSILTISADDLIVEKTDFGKASAKQSYLKLSDKNEKEKFVVVSLDIKRLKHISECAPTPLLKYIVSATSSETLALIRKICSPRLAAVIDIEAEKRDAADAEAVISPSRSKRKNKRKKHKKKK